MTAQQIGNPDIYYTIPEATKILGKMGIKNKEGRPLSERAVEEHARRRTLPFFKSFDGRWRISDAELRAALRRPQMAAVRETLSGTA